MNCPACAEGTRHTPEELAQYHPLAGHGYRDGQGWCCPEAERAHNEELAQKLAGADLAHRRAEPSGEGPVPEQASIGA